MAQIPPPNFSEDGAAGSEGLPQSGPGFVPPRGPMAPVEAGSSQPEGGMKRDHRGEAKYDFSRALKFITENNPDLDDDMQVMRVFSAGGAVELIYQLPPWTCVEVGLRQIVGMKLFIVGSVLI